MLLIMRRAEDPEHQSWMFCKVPKLKYNSELEL